MLAVLASAPASLVASGCRGERLCGPVAVLPCCTVIPLNCGATIVSRWQADPDRRAVCGQRTGSGAAALSRDYALRVKRSTSRCVHVRAAAQPVARPIAVASHDHLGSPRPVVSTRVSKTTRHDRPLFRPNNHPGRAATLQRGRVWASVWGWRWWPVLLSSLLSGRVIRWQADPDRRGVPTIEGRKRRGVQLHAAPFGAI